jgi:hypothetical protein
MKRKKQGSLFCESLPLAIEHFASTKLNISRQGIEQFFFGTFDAFSALSFPTGVDNEVA